MPLTRRQAAWLQFPTIAFRFPSINQAVKWLRSEGMSYHYQTMWRDVSSTFQRANKGPAQREYGPNALIPQKLFIERDWKRSETYKYYGNVYFEDVTTGELYFHSYSVYTETSLSDADVEKIVRAREEQRKDKYNPNWVVSSFESIDRYHKWGGRRSENYGIARI